MVFVPGELQVLLHKRCQLRHSQAKVFIHKRHDFSVLYLWVRDPAEGNSTRREAEGQVYLLRLVWRANSPSEKGVSEVECCCSSRSLVYR